MKINLDKILNEFDSFTRSLENINSPQLISFAFNFQKFDPLSFIDKLNELSTDIFLLLYSK